MTDRPSRATAAWALWRWLLMGLQRLMHQAVALAVGLLGILFAAVLIPPDQAGDAAAYAGIASGLLLYFGGGVAATVGRQIARPLGVLALLGAATISASAALANTVVGGLLGTLGAMWLLTLIEFVLRGAGRAGLTGDRAVLDRPIPPEPGNGGWRWPDRTALSVALVAAYLGLALALLSAVLIFFY